ncbi:MAG: bifunctional 4-hydroxy-3-methylbut-2-enyl diphosphate reductase/30S ribosomal protein S1 [Clostridia bacterium]|nr:bifunctional 4-hydroxy-3-methylbut-2-enyl diphosphate reductase/30S ribosomal protein S1 [Clostridia bacterium]
MEIILAKSAGFCFGVKRAVDHAYSKAGQGDIYTYGPIIHNKEVTGDLDKKGVHVIENLDEVKEGEIIIRSHGVPPDVYEEIEGRGLKYTDCTCPFVKKIHNIVMDNYNKGRSIIIVGNKTHPEIIGINGWCKNTAIIINSIEEAQSIELEKEISYALVVQTTFQTDVFENIIACLKEKSDDIEVFRTICSATGDRQKEAVEIAKIADQMIVLGDKSSSNTRKLYEISKKYCKNVYLCERICDLELQNIKKNGTMGITAGASTPSVIIKEAVNAMSEMENKSFEEMLDDSLVTLRTGQIVKGTVISVSDTGEVSVNLGYKSDGIIARTEFSDDVNVNPADVVKPGDEIEVFVIRVNDGEGNVQLSKKKVDADKNYVVIEEAFNNGTPVKGKVTEQVKGGLIAMVNGARVFVPSSQISNRYVEDLSTFIGKEFDFEVLEFDKSKRRIVVGRKALAQKEIDAKRAEVFASINVGDKIEGKVSRIVEFGAFVDLGGVDGLIHISEMSWGRVKKVTDVLSVGDNVTVTVLDVNPEKGKISLSLKDLNADPWKDAETKYAVGNVVSGKVVRMVSFGAFVELEEGVDGLVHISQIAYKHVEKPEDELTIGQEIQAKVTELDLAAKKISLSIKETLEKPARASKAEESAETEAE